MTETYPRHKKSWTKQYLRSKFIVRNNGHNKK